MLAYGMYILKDNHLAGKEAVIVLCLFLTVLVVWSAKCDCGNSWSYSLTFYLKMENNAQHFSGDYPGFPTDE